MKKPVLWCVLITSCLNLLWDLTILWDRSGSKYHKGKGLRIFADGIEIANSDRLTSLKCTRP